MEAFTEQFQEQRLRLRKYIERRVPDGHVADDILQEIYLKLHANLSGIRSSASVTAWLYRVAANAIVDYYRARRPTAELPEHVPSPRLEDDSLTALASCINPLIDELPEKYRKALQLSEIEGLTQKEAADRLGISLSGLKSRVQRGREKLRQRLTQCCAVEVGPNGIAGYEIRDPNCRCGAD